jgi:hypothetical protein
MSAARGSPARAAASTRPFIQYPPRCPGCCSLLRSPRALWPCSSSSGAEPPHGAARAGAPPSPAPPPHTPPGATSGSADPCNAPNTQPAGRPRARSDTPSRPPAPAAPEQPPASPAPEPTPGHDAPHRTPSTARYRNPGRSPCTPTLSTRHGPTPRPGIRRHNAGRSPREPPFLGGSVAIDPASQKYPRCTRVKGGKRTAGVMVSPRA